MGDCRVVPTAPAIVARRFGRLEYVSHAATGKRCILLATVLRRQCRSWCCYSRPDGGISNVAFKCPGACDQDHVLGHHPRRISFKISRSSPCSTTTVNCSRSVQARRASCPILGSRVLKVRERSQSARTNPSRSPKLS